jgi:hypothetical protein
VDWFISKIGKGKSRGSSPPGAPHRRALLFPSSAGEASGASASCGTQECQASSALPLLCSCSQDNPTGVLEATSKFGTRARADGWSAVHDGPHVVENFLQYSGLRRTRQLRQLLRSCSFFFLRAYVMEKRHVCTSPFLECLHLMTPAVTEVCQYRRGMPRDFEQATPEDAFHFQSQACQSKEKL